MRKSRQHLFPSHSTSFFQEIKGSRDQIVFAVIRNNGSWEDGEDVYQEACCRAFLNLENGTVVEPGKEKAYLKEIARRIWLEELRMKKKIASSMPEEVMSEEEGEEDDLGWKKCLKSCLGDVKPSHQKILLWGFFKETTDEEIAEEIGYKNGQVVRQTRYRIFPLLRACVKKCLLNS